MPSRLPKGGISGLAVFITAAGGYLVYAGIKDVPLREGLRELLAGRIHPGRPPVVTPAGGGAGTGSAAAGGTGLGAAIVRNAEGQLGKRYQWAAAGPDRFDCSGLAVFSIRAAGKSCPRLNTTAFMVWPGARTVSGPPQPGDLVIRPGHMGIATGPTTMIHAPGAGRTVTRANIWKVPPPIVRRVVGDVERRPLRGGF